LNDILGVGTGEETDHSQLKNSAANSTPTTQEGGGKGAVVVEKPLY